LIAFGAFGAFGALGDTFGAFGALGDIFGDFGALGDIFGDFGVLGTFGVFGVFGAFTLAVAMAYSFRVIGRLEMRVIHYLVSNGSVAYNIRVYRLIPF
jgi:hypothetical protein